ncbi:hypothetical protein N8Z24_00700 [bacterium]|nr:hypothetical protein [bacterium]
MAVADGAVTIPFGTLASGDLLYIGSDAAVDIKLNGSVDAISLEADGYILISDGGITAATVEATLLTATVQVLILGA